MKKQFLFVILTVGTLLPASADLYSYSTGNVNGSGTSLDQAIPDGQYPIGITSTIDVSGLADTLGTLTVTLNIAGGWNGDLYGYLSYNGTLVTLLNRVGTGTGDQIQNDVGFSTSGFNNITLADDGEGGNIHNVETPVSSTTYSADGGLLSSFDGLNPNGAWTLFLADESQGGQSTLVGWSMEIVTVPEPSSLTLAILGAALAGGILVRRRFRLHSRAKLAAIRLNSFHP